MYIYIYIIKTMTVLFLENLLREWEIEDNMLKGQGQMGKTIHVPTKASSSMSCVRVLLIVKDMHQLIWEISPFY